MMAVRAGDDDLAKEALLRQKEHETLSAEFERQWQKQKTAVEQLKGALRVLNNKIEEAKRKKNVLIARKKRAEAQKAIHETMSRLSNDSAFETFNRMEEKIVQMEAEADAQGEVAEQYSGDSSQQKFKDLETTRGADVALDELKRKMGLAARRRPCAQQRARRRHPRRGHRPRRDRRGDHRGRRARGRARRRPRPAARAVDAAPRRGYPSRHADLQLPLRRLQP
jgi:phage shock protein A